MKKSAGKKRNDQPSTAAKPGSKAGTAASASGRASAAAKPDSRPPKPLDPEILRPLKPVPVLNAAEKLELDRCEKTIRHGWQSFVEVGEALLKIRDGELFRDRYASFEDYYREVWNYQKSQVYRLMDAAKVVRAISPIGEKPVDGLLLPTCEAQVRPLVKLADTEIKDVWQKAAEQAKTSNAPITARLVQLQVRAVTPLPAEKSLRRNDVPDNKTIVSRLFDRLFKMIDNEKRAEAEDIRNQVLNLVPRIKGTNSKGKLYG